ncbi:hypothetical protein LTR86_007446 [Recurvomyces mirabilis]|nr:hypothetical protein LTR86_007446 [Recurvomyces mirabilis]
MAFPNPTINPPKLASSASYHRQLHSRSPSRSPVRQARDYDPLLRDLSPTATLRAFSTDAPSRHDSTNGALTNSFDAASASERAFGARAAKACLDLRSWVRELESWEWPGTFETPDYMEEGDEAAYSGSIASGLVYAYELRADEIARERDGLDLEDMKRFVLSAHGRSGGDNPWFARNSVNMSAVQPDVRHLDDFTALITATILQALPYLSSLNRLLDVWTIRLLICRQASAFLADLAQAKRDLDQGWAAIAVSSAHDRDLSSEDLTHEKMQDMQGVIERQVNSLGRRLDNFLDQLEGRKETVPEPWIEDFETLESAYSEWVVHAERKVLEDEWRTARVAESRGVEHAKAEEMLTAQPYADDSRKVSEPFNNEDHTRDHDSLIAPTSRPVSDIYDQAPEQIRAGTVRSFIVPNLPSDGRNMPREDSQTLPEQDAGQVQRSRDADEIDASSLVRPSLVHSPSKRSRHMPIVINYDDPSEIHPMAENTEKDADERFVIPDMAAQIQNDENFGTTSNVAKKRAAFANGDLERATSLQRQVKSPVRPFEHASNAFTRLFKKDKTPEPSRSSSQISNNSAKEKDSKRPRGDSNNGVVWGGQSPPATSPPAKEPTLNPHDAMKRSRSLSYRSHASQARSDNYSGATVDSVPISIPHRQRMPSREASYLDMPGGMPRSRSSDSRSRTLSNAARDSYQSQERRLERIKPETYQPTRSMASTTRRPSSSKALQEVQYPADWPLASPTHTGTNSPVKEDLDSQSPQNHEPQTIPAGAEEAIEADDSSPEILSPRIAMETNAFDRFLVDSFPNSPDLELQTSRSVEQTMSQQQRPRHARKRSEVPTVSEEMLEDRHGEFDMFDLALPIPGEDTEGERTMDDGFIFGTDADDSTVEVPRQRPASRGRVVLIDDTAEQHAGSGYFPDPNHAQDDVNGIAQMHHARSRSVSPVSPPLRLHIPDLHSQVAAESGYGHTRNQSADTDASSPGAEIMDAKPVLVNRASMASIASLPRSALRSIDMSRNRSSQLFGSSGSASIGAGPRSAPLTPREPVSAIEPGADSMPTSPMEYRSNLIFPSPPMGIVSLPGSRGNSRPSSRPRSPVSPIESRDHSPEKVTHFVPSSFSSVRHSIAGAERHQTDSNRDGEIGDDSPRGTASSTNSPFAPLNAGMAKRGQKSSRFPNGVSAPTKPASRDGPLKPGEDTFDRHVSDVLDRLPSHAIKFKPRPGAKTPDSGKKADARRPRAPGRTSSINSTAADMTLAPAEASQKKSAEDVKVYHLTQAGRDEPIKLFVRLVGENERVMVRVGGGWADLADYLRQYAEHHGSRTVSGAGGERGLELQTVDTVGGASARKVSSSSAVNAAVGRGTPATPTVGTARAGFRMDDGTGSEDGERDSPTAAGDSFPEIPSFDTPKSTVSTSRTNSRPSTANSLNRPGSRPGSKQQTTPQSQSSHWPLTNAALSGPGSAGKDLPEQKARWVEGMLERAKVSSATNSTEKSRDEKGKGSKFWGELGKAGGTRRVVFRQGSTSGKDGGNGRT